MFKMLALLWYWSRSFAMHILILNEIFKNVDDHYFGTELLNFLPWTENILSYNPTILTDILQKEIGKQLKSYVVLPVWLLYNGTSEIWPPKIWKVKYSGFGSVLKNIFFKYITSNVIFNDELSNKKLFWKPNYIFHL